MNDQMLPINLGRRPVELLVLGAHADDIEIGCGGTILRLRLAGDGLVGRLTWVVLSGLGPRAVEARTSAAVFLEDVQEPKGIVRDFRDGFFPYVGAAVKEFFEELKLEVQPDLTLAHRRGDQHQDHRLVAELTWNTWRHYLILEYEIPKYEGNLGAPTLFVPLSRDTCASKVELPLKNFPSQTLRRWFTADTFWALLRLRGLECNAPSGFAEGLYARKLVL
jgi:LmbE family N-acetylglucosaminyl deacetylase